MMELVFATHNKYKAEEINKILGSRWNIRSLDDIGYGREVPENGITLEDNALQKARYIWEEIGANCFADDTGLEIDALNGAPGVFSARYAGPSKDSGQNMKKVLEEMEHIEDRKARFRTVIALIWNGEEFFFEGAVEGMILKEKSGSQGFGYDPIFLPEGFERSFANMSVAEKNQISHRGRAIRKLVDHLESL